MILIYFKFILILSYKLLKKKMESNYNKNNKIFIPFKSIFHFYSNNIIFFISIFKYKLTVINCGNCNQALLFPLSNLNTLNTLMTQNCVSTAPNFILIYKFVLVLLFCYGKFLRPLNKDVFFFFVVYFIFRIN